ncbi:hypothetical protein RJ639_044873 [Escallonia herrerae]|uniref:Uncharacterized protein n=1 Tax=Escallonia herrerae TaxID=1293975 RepID=A0AA88WF79_9ASTE|nr:hypothetical protein RJ639_044873 [Escallonia herrerae]
MSEKTLRAIPAQRVLKLLMHLSALLPHNDGDEPGYRCEHDQGIRKRKKILLIPTYACIGLTFSAHAATTIAAGVLTVNGFGSLLYRTLEDMKKSKVKHRFFKRTGDC